MNERILVIENQYLQFDLLKKGLLSNDRIKERGIDILPSDKDQFRKLIGAVKVYANKSYSKEYREICQDAIFEFVAGKEKDNPVDLIILDYKLGGSIECLTGVDIAKLIWAYFPKIPVLFLSRVDYSVRDRYFQVDDIETKYKKEWLMKGFMGDETLDGDYINYTIYNKLVSLLDGPSAVKIGENDELIKKVEFIIQLDLNPYVQYWETLLIYLKDKTKPSLPFEIKKLLIEQDKRSPSFGEDLYSFIQSISN